MSGLSDARGVVTVADLTPAEQEHLRLHLTDGSWHDRCPYCLNRRVKGGTGAEVGGDDRG